MIKAFEDVIDKASQSGDYDLVKAVLKEKKEFALDYTKLPSSIHMKKAKTDFIATIKNARKVLEDSHKKAIIAYTKAKKIHEATLVDDEWNKFKNSLPIFPPPIVVSEKGNMLKPYSIWIGKGYHNNDVDNEHVLLIITEVADNTFKGIIKFLNTDDGKINLYEFEATIKNGRFQYTRSNCEVTGTIDNDKLTAKWSVPNTNKHGEFALKNIK